MRIHKAVVAQLRNKADKAKERLEELRKAIQAENISYGEIAELQSLVDYIEPGDVELLQWAKPATLEEEIEDSLDNVIQNLQTLDHTALALAWLEWHGPEYMYQTLKDDITDYAVNNTTKETAEELARFLCVTSNMPDDLCPKYGEPVLPDENGNCSLCGLHKA